MDLELTVGGRKTLIVNFEKLAKQFGYTCVHMF